MTTALIIMFKALFLIVSLMFCNLAHSIVNHPFSSKKSSLEWEDLGATPSRDFKFVPQGMAYVNNKLYLAESHNDEKGYVYEIHVKGSKHIVENKFQLPVDAVHTSGLTWDGEFLWAVDYLSKKLYKIDIERSLETGTAKVLDEYGTGLNGVSANTYFVFKNEEYMAVSDFLNTKRTYIIPHGNYKKDEPIFKQAIFSFKNKWFSQGLAWSGEHLYEATNFLGRDVVYQLDLCTLFRSGSFNKSVVKKFNAPYTMVEDLVITENGTMYTSDEKSFSIYKTDLKTFSNNEVKNCKIEMGMPGYRNN